MLKYFFVITLALPVCVFAEKSKPQCIDGTNKEVNLAYDHFRKMLTNYVQKPDSESFTNLNTSATTFVTIYETCAGEKKPKDSNITFYMDLIKFAVKDDKYSKFINSNGSTCVDAVKLDVQSCLHTNLGTPRGADSNDTNVKENDLKDVSGSGNLGTTTKPNATDSNAPPQNADENDINVKGYNSKDVDGSSNLGTTTNPNATDNNASPQVAAGNVKANDIDGSGGKIFNDGGSNTAGAHGITDGNTANGPRIKQNLQALLKKAYLDFKTQACDKTNEIKRCVRLAMNKQNAKCTAEHSKFVESLFEFSLKKCAKPSPLGNTHNKKSGANSFLFNPVVILLPLVGAMLLK